MMRKTAGTFLGIILGIHILSAGNALQFNGIDEYVQLSELLSIGSSSNTVEMWVKVPEVGSGNLEEGERVGIMLGNYDSPQDAGWEIHSDGQIRIWWNGNPEIRGAKDLRDNTWHHVAFVRDKVNDKILGYVDGELEFEENDCGTDLTFTTKHRIGADNRTSGMPYFHGEIDELRIWNTARTQSQIREYMCEDVSGQSGLLAYYRMTDGSGMTLSDNTGTNTGTLVNMDNSNWSGDHLVPEGDGSTTPYQIKKSEPPVLGVDQQQYLEQ